MAFQTTHWSVVAAAQGKDSEARHDALGALCSAYWYPLYAFVRRRGHGPHEAEDLTQEFFRRFLEREGLARVEPAGGKLRSFLLTCLKNFLANERERAHAQRRGGGQAVLSLDAEEAEARWALEPADLLTPEAVYERECAFVVIARALEDLRQTYSTPDKRLLFQDLEGFLPGGLPGLTRAEIAAKRGVSPGAIDVAIHRLRKDYALCLRARVAETVSAPAEVDEELRHLREFMVKSGI